jgi:hypothetical protein
MKTIKRQNFYIEIVDFTNTIHIKAYNKRDNKCMWSKTLNILNGAEVREVQ